MNGDLARLISDYQGCVREAVAVMHDSGIPLPESNVAWAINGIPRRGVLSGGLPYFKHGHGCAVGLPGGHVDFDFGEHGEIDGFDASRLADFAGPGLAGYGFASEAALEACLSTEVMACSLTRRGNLLHCIAPATR